MHIVSDQQTLEEVLFYIHQPRSVRSFVKGRIRPNRTRSHSMMAGSESPVSSQFPEGPTDLGKGDAGASGEEKVELSFEEQLNNDKTELLELIVGFEKEDNDATVRPILDLLKSLEDRRVSPTHLKSTGIGLAVGKLRKHSSEEVRVAAKRVVNKWKNYVLPSRKRPPDSGEQPSLQLYPPSLLESSRPQKRSKTNAQEKPADDFIRLSVPSHEYHDDRSPSVAGDLRAQLDKLFPVGRPYAVGKTGDSTRDKIQSLLLEALASPDSDNQAKVSVRLETAMFIHFGNTGADYKDKYRTIILNLRDPKNPDINQRLLLEQLSPETAVLLHPSQLASASLQEQRDERLKEHKEASRSDLGSTQAMTDQFTCGKCKQNRTTYYQQQTRSADEPMTTFVMCVECGHRWKF